MGIWISTRPDVVVPGVLDTSRQEAHITLAYLCGKTHTDQQATFDNLKKWLETNIRPKRMRARVNGLATWIVPGMAEPYYLVALVATNRALLHNWRSELAIRMDQAGFHLNNDFPFLPHITIGHADLPYVKMPVLQDPAEFWLNNLYVSRGSSHHERIW